MPVFFIFLLCLLFFPPITEAGFPRTPIPGIFTRDLTIYRTVNTLSCHPQNPLLHEVPHYVMFNPQWTPLTGGPYQSKGGCWAYHNEGNTNFIEVDFQKPGLPGSEDVNILRPASPTHHYMVIEVPNPNYDPTKETQCMDGILTGGAAFCGKYMHWEGYSFMFELALVAGSHEVWYIKNFLGGMDVQGRNIVLQDLVGTVKLNAQGLPDPNGTSYTVYGGKLNEGITNVHWKACQGWATADGPIRLGERGSSNSSFISGYPCIDIIFTMHDVPLEVYANPFLFTDIAHNRFSRNPRNEVHFGDGDQFPIRDWYDDLTSKPDNPNDYLRDNNDDLWVKCNGKSGQRDVFLTMFGKYNLNSYRAYIDKFRAFIADPDANNIPIAPYTPAGCDYNPLQDDPGIEWTTLNNQPFPNAGPKPTTQAQLVALTNKWLSSPASITPQPSQGTPTPTNTSTPTSQPSSPIPKKLGDVDGDGHVTIADFNEVIGFFGLTTTVGQPFRDADLDKSSRVWIEDFNEVLANLGA